ncbi:MAG TPA: xanthine dehydrogenase family protein molybdopterin-binding subunit [Dehalococcoidia bacterium]|nr:xanthine dehydrogenase family protein molybdopterin-binding subunit [Dehalococcoidia bacterium]
MVQTPHRVIGQRAVKVDALDRVTGRANYGADISLPGMLHGKVVRSPYAHARIKRIDTSKARALPGVKAVITAADFPDLKEVGRANLGEMEINMRDLAHLIMARDKVVFSAQAVAAVAATDPHTAEAACDLIEVEYEELPVVNDVMEAIQPGAPVIHSDLFMTGPEGKATTPGNISTHAQFKRGDVEAGFAQADTIVERWYRTPMVHQTYLEPDASAARWDGDKLTVWTSTQGAFTVRVQLAALLNIPQAQIKVIPTEIGGGFGAKIYCRIDILAALLAKQAGRPVRIVMTREEVLRATGPGAPTVNWVKVGAKRDGTLTALATKMYFDAGAYPGSPAGNAIMMGFAPYQCDNLLLDAYDCVTNKPRVNAYRAPGATQAAFAVESAVDELAQRLEIDPLDLRIKNASKTGDPMPNNATFNSIGLVEVLERVKQSPAWTAPLEGEYRGRGLALGFWRNGTFTSTCHLSVTADGSVVVTMGAVDLTGTRTTMGQIAAEEFGLDVGEVKVIMGDTDSAGYSDVTGGSRVTYTMSTALKKACDAALEQLRAKAAQKLDCSPEDILYENRTFSNRDGSKSVTLKDLAADLARGHFGGPVVATGTATRMQLAPAFAAHIADVEVDPETGKVKVLKYTAFQDVGKAINPQQVEGRMQGGVTQGIGWGLSEEYLFENGFVKNASLLDYRLPTALDVPMIDCEIIEVPASDGAYGARGVGEVPIVPPPAAIGNAIVRATGVRLTELPMKPERVFWAIKEQQRVTVPVPRNQI